MPAHAFEEPRIAGQRDHGRQMPPGRTAHGPDSPRIDPEPPRVGAHPSDRRLAILHRRRKLRLARKPIIDGRRDKTLRRQSLRHRAKRQSIAARPTAAMDDDHSRKWPVARSRGSIEIELQIPVAALSKHHAGLPDDPRRNLIPDAGRFRPGGDLDELVDLHSGGELWNRRRRDGDRSDDAKEDGRGFL